MAYYGYDPMNGAATAARIWDVLMKIAVPVSFVAAASLITHEIRLASIESNRFTNGDGSQMESKLKEWVEQRYPPTWLREQLKDIHDQTVLIPVMDERLKALDERVQRLEKR